MVELTHRQDIHNCAALLCSIARWWVRLPDDQIVLLRQLVGATKPDRELLTMSPKNRSTLRCFQDADLVSRFLHIPDRVFRQHPSPRTASEALQLQLATAVAMLTAAPVRIKNLSATRIDVNLLRQGSTLHLHYPPSEVKNNVELEFKLPTHTAKCVDGYLSRARPLLCGMANPHLFPSSDRKAKTPGFFSRQIASFVEGQIGVRLTAHQFRHLAGFLYLMVNPNGYEVVRLLLGHKDISTTVKFYAGMEIEAAYRRYDDFIARRRDEI
jgi:integrase